jgi:hypothetical protein
MNNLLCSNKYAVSMLLDSLRKYLTTELGQKCIYNDKQIEELEKLPYSGLQDYKNHLIDSWIRNGIRLLDTDLYKILETLNYLYENITNKDIESLDK